LENGQLIVATGDYFGDFSELNHGILSVDLDRSADWSAGLQVFSRVHYSSWPEWEIRSVSCRAGPAPLKLLATPPWVPHQVWLRHRWIAPGEPGWTDPDQRVQARQAQQAQQARLK